MVAYIIIVWLRRWVCLKAWNAKILDEMKLQCFVLSQCEPSWKLCICRLDWPLCWQKWDWKSVYYHVKCSHGHALFLLLLLIHLLEMSNALSFFLLILWDKLLAILMVVLVCLEVWKTVQEAHERLKVSIKTDCLDKHMCVCVCIIYVSY